MEFDLHNISLNDFEAWSSKSAVGIAVRFNLWIKYHQRWHTPGEFAHRMHGQVFKGDEKRGIIFLNPIEELDRGRWLIIGMVKDRWSAETIIQAIKKMGNFEKRIRDFYNPTGWNVDLNNIKNVVEQYYVSALSDIIYMRQADEFKEAKEVVYRDSPK